MKKLTILLFSMLLTILLTGCSETEKYEVDLITVRVYTVTEQSGLFTTKENACEYIEYTFEFCGEPHVDREKITDIDIGNETKIIVTGKPNGYVVYSDLKLSMEDYKKIHGLED